MLLSAIALLLLILNLNTDTLAVARQQLSVLATPFYRITNWPRQLDLWRNEASASRLELLQEQKRLQAELLIHQRKLQQMAALAAENVRLRQLMNAAELLQDDVLIAELIGVSPNPLTHTVLLNRGLTNGVYSGQPVLDAKGLMGQVIDVGIDSSSVLLITDPTHAIPVQVNRTGFRAIAEGTGDLIELTLRHVPNTTDIRIGDLLVSSGLGQRFPVGYPVAIVERVTHDPGQPFATIAARPMAELSSSRNVLLIFDSTTLEF